MLNRSAVIIRCNQQFVDWINNADRSSGKKLTLAECNDDSTVYLIEAEDQHEFEKWLKKYPLSAQVREELDAYKSRRFLHPSVQNLPSID